MVYFKIMHADTKKAIKAHPHYGPSWVNGDHGIGRHWWRLQLELRRLASGAIFSIHQRGPTCVGKLCSVRWLNLAQTDPFTVPLGGFTIQSRDVDVEKKG